MKIFLASATPSEIGWATDHGLADGVVTTPLLLAEQQVGSDGRELLSEICRLVSLPVFASVTSLDPNDIHREGRELGRISDNIVVQVPLVDDAVVAIRRLVMDGFRVAATQVFSPAQALLAAKAGAKVVSISVDELDAVGQDGTTVIGEMRQLLDRAAPECDIMAVSPRTAAQFTAVGLAGADSIVLRSTDISAFLVHPLTDRGLDRFLRELALRPKPRIVPV